MSNDSSLTAGNFDLETQAGVANLLLSVRSSDIDKSQKNEIRDLVFQYMNGGQDQTIRIAIEQKLNKHSIEPVKTKIAKKESSTPSKPKEFGSTRPSPQFAPARKSQLAPEDETAKEETEQPKPEPAPKTPEPTSTPEPAPASAPEPETTPASEPVEAPEPKPTPEPQPATESKPTPTPESAATPQPQPAPVFDSGQNIKRIKEIKSLVNQKIGNPVNLVDINNEVGREYMSAMLDAMKQINTGSSAVSAMKRLEDAYQAVEKTLENRDLEQVSSEPQPSPAKTEPTPEPPKSPEPAPTPETAPEPKPTSEPEPTRIPVPESTPAPKPQTTPESVPTKPESPQKPEPKPTPEPVEAPKPASAPQAETVPVRKPQTEELVEKQTPSTSEKKDNESRWDNPQPDTESKETPDKPVATPTPESEDLKAQSLAETKTELKKPEDLPEASSVETSSVAGDPLYTKEVDSGLNQLLSEWPIFKKSGLFGTGPKGIEHPLFKKISGLQIPLLLAGRFEGATQEIKQSITDYMNGWRYEQGIIYKQGETFEHYLRRVIKHILDLQN